MEYISIICWFLEKVITSLTCMKEICAIILVSRWAPKVSVSNPASDQLSSLTYSLNNGQTYDLERPARDIVFTVMGQVDKPGPDITLVAAMTSEE